MITGDDTMTMLYPSCVINQRFLRTKNEVPNGFAIEDIVWVNLQKCESRDLPGLQPQTPRPPFITLRDDVVPTSKTHR